MAAETIGQIQLRKENIERDVKGFALQEAVLLDLLSEKNGSAEEEAYFEEDSSTLAGQGTRNLRGISRFSEFPSARTKWSKKTTTVEKYAAEDEIAMEDVTLSNIDALARMKIRIAHGIAEAIDTKIWNTLSEDRSPTNINSVVITAGNEWDASIEANRDPVFNIMKAIEEIEIDNIRIRDGGGFLVLNPTDYTNIIRNSKVSNNPSYKALADVGNGIVASFLNLTIKQSNVVTADYAMVVKSKTVGT